MRIKVSLVKPKRSKLVEKTLPYRYLDQGWPSFATHNKSISIACKRPAMESLVDLHTRIPAQFALRKIYKQLFEQFVPVDNNTTVFEIGAGAAGTAYNFLIPEKLRPLWHQIEPSYEAIEANIWFTEQVLGHEPQIAYGNIHELEVPRKGRMVLFLLSTLGNIFHLEHALEQAHSAMSQGDYLIVIQDLFPTVNSTLLRVRNAQKRIGINQDFKVRMVPGTDQIVEFEFLGVWKLMTEFLRGEVLDIANTFRFSAMIKYPLRAACHVKKGLYLESLKPYEHLGKWPDLDQEDRFFLRPPLEFPVLKWVSFESPFLEGYSHPADRGIDETKTPEGYMFQQASILAQVFMK